MSKFTDGLKKTGNGILNGAALLADASILSKMTDIERQIDALQAEYAALNQQVDASRQRPTPYK